MNYYISNEEYAEISAKLDASLENLEFSDSEEMIGERPNVEYIPVASSIVDSENWKKFIDLRKTNEEEHLAIQEKFSEALSSLREATNEAKIEIRSELAIINEELIETKEELDLELGKIRKNSENFGKIEGKTLENQNFCAGMVEIEEQIEKNKEKEEEENENLFMKEEDMLSELLRKWTKKEIQIKKKNHLKESARLENNLKEKREREDYLKSQEKILIERAKEEKLRQEKILLENKKKEEELKNEIREVKIMQSEEIFSKNMNDYYNMLMIQENQRKEQKFISKEDQFSKLFRDLVPYRKRKLKIITETSDFPKVSFPALEISLSRIVLPVFSKKPIQNIEKLPQKLALPHITCPEKLPKFTEESDLELPTLPNFFPFPLDSNSESLDVKDENIRSISGLSQFKNLKLLTLSLNKISKIQNLPPSLTFLNLSQNLITSIPELNLPLIEEIILDLNQITAISGLSKCMNLRILSMNCNQLNSISGLEKCPILEKLSLYRNKIKEISPNTFQYNTYLLFLDLGRNKLRSVNFVKGVKLLKSLILYENMIGEIEKINLPLLQEIWLNGNALKKLDFIENCPLLNTLRLEDNTISSVSAFECELLKNLNISFNSIEKFSEIINCVRGCRNLTNFSFNDNPFILTHPEFLGLFSEILVKSLPNIQELNNTPRTSLQKLRINCAKIAKKAFELHQIDLFYQRVKRKNEIIRFLSTDFKKLLFELPTRILQEDHENLEFVCKNIEFHWYEARKKLYFDTLAALKIQTWWKTRQFKRFRIIQKYSGFKSQITTIQKNFRGYRTRKNFVNLKYDPKKIVKIQANFRGYLLRKKLKKALENAKVNDIDLEEFKEVNMDDIEMNYDFNEELIIPKNLDIAKFFVQNEESKTPKLPPLKPNSAFKSQNINPINRSISNEKSLQNSTQSSLPPINKNKIKEDIEKNINEWHFTNDTVKEALQYRIMKNLKRKTKAKKMTADEKLEKFRRNSKK